MPFDTILYEVKDLIATITLNRPDALNSITPLLLTEARQALDQAAADRNVSVIILTGAGRAFCAGVDLVAMTEQLTQGVDAEEVLHKPARALIEAMADMPKIIIGAVNGYCLTGGLELALGCDLIIASEKAKFGDTHTKWGLRCLWGMSYRLPARVGWLKAQEMTYTSRTVLAEEAVRIGLACQCVPKGELEASARYLAQGIMANDPHAVAAHKQLYVQGIRDAWAAAARRELETPFEMTGAAKRIGGFGE